MSEASLGEVVARQTSRLVAPAFTIALVVFGGASSGAFYANGALQIVSALILAWCAVDGRLNQLSIWAWSALALFGAFVAVASLQLVPLPPELWTRLPGRDGEVEGFKALGVPLPWLPISMAPEETVFGLLKFLPALAAFVLAAKTPWRTLTAYVFWTLVLIAVASVMLGLAQVFGGRESGFYFYRFTNWGQPVGFMANVNHQATFLLMTIPFAAVLGSRLAVRSELGDADIGIGLILAALVVTIVLGVMIAGSMAGYGLFLPAIILAILVGRHRGGRTSAVFLLVAALILATLGVIVASSPVLTALGLPDFSTGTLSRPDTYARTLRAISDVMPVGSGLGSFEALFPSYEDPNQVTATYMNHAHSDYLEFTLELGVAGVVLLVGVIAWILARSIAAWRSHDGEEDIRVRRAASAALLIVMLHSVVDYPLRTAAVSGLAGLCAGLLAARSGQNTRRPSKKTSDQAQHVTI